MKHLVSTLLILIVLVGQSLYGQSCTPDAAAVLAGVPGFFPDPINAGLPDGKENIAYDQDITTIVLDTLTVDLSALAGFPGLPTLDLSVDQQELTNVTGLPTGLTWTCDPANCTWLNGANGCIDISGTPTQFGTFAVVLEVEMTVTVPASVPFIGGQTLAAPVPVTYDLTIAPEVGIEEDLNPNAFDLVQNVPNPASNHTSIFFNTPQAKNILLTMHNIIGQLVMSKSHLSNTGQNKIDLDLSGMKEGIYFYTLSNGDVSLTKKMIINR